MAGFFNALSACGVLLLIMSLGYLMGKLGWMTAQEKKFVSQYIINIAVPCNCIAGLLNNLDRDSLAQAAMLVLCAMVSVAVCLLISAGLAWTLRLPQRRWGVFVTMAGFSNVLFIGIPVCTQLFGEVCVPQVMLYYLAQTSLLQSVGIILVERAGVAGGQKRSLPAVLGGMICKPPILGIFGSIALLALGLRLPAPLMRVAEYVSDSVTPLALIYCGFIIYEIGLKNLRLMPGHGVMLVFRLVAAPAICMGLCALFGVTGLTRSVFVVESALPVVSQVTVMAGAYGADEQYAASGACLSIFGSFITLPLLMLIL